MINQKQRLTIFWIGFLAFFWASCKKDVAQQPQPYQLSYGDSILYLQPAAGDYIVYPTIPRSGTYAAFPEGIQIDENTGAINISDSETGLRYRITHTDPDGTKTETKVVLSGITFTDHYYKISSGDSIAAPVYNANPSTSLPIAGSIFDEGNTANSGGCSVKTNNGTINLAETIRNGVFGSVPQNDERRDFDIEYRLNDASDKSKNKLKVRLYYYDTMADVPQDLLDLLNDREAQGLFLRSALSPTIPSVAMRGQRLAKPRPPCIILVAN